jgi:hypothetical protein
MSSRVSPIRTDSAWELLNILGQLDISVPLRTEGRTTEHCERWSICRFLASFSDSELLSFPLSLVHRDKPDFLLEFGQRKVGIEATEAVPENDAAIDAYRENKEIDGLFFLKRHLPGDAKLRGADLKQEASSDDPGNVWGGDSVEREWAGAMKSFVIGKVAKSKKPDFDLFEKNWLLMYDNWPLPALDQAVAVKKLFESITVEEYWPFENIFIECSSQFWALNRNGYYSRLINNLWARS